VENADHRQAPCRLLLSWSNALSTDSESDDLMITRLPCIVYRLQADSLVADGDVGAASGGGAGGICVTAQVGRGYQVSWDQI
jgi:hypothetical protein